jgi:hypothetical protein
MADEFKALELLRSLGDFGDPTGPAARVQTDTLMIEMRRLALEDPDTRYRITEDGPEQTIAEILAELDAEDAAITAMKSALEDENKRGR